MYIYIILNDLLNLHFVFQISYVEIYATLGALLTISYWGLDKSFAWNEANSWLRMLFPSSFVILACKFYYGNTKSEVGDNMISRNLCIVSEIY